jgi:tetratricopeptide (TPR) repeat protein
MNSILHEAGWREVIYCLFVGTISLFSLITLIRQLTKEHEARVQAELNRAVRVERGEIDPLPVEPVSPTIQRSLLTRSLLIAAHSFVVVGSLYLGLPALKSALYTHQGNTAFVEHDYDTAVKRYESALAANPFASSLRLQYQSALAQSDAKGGDLGELKRMVQLHPGNEGDHNDLGNALMRKGDLADAIKEYQQAVALNPENAIVHNNLGNALQAAHRYPESIQELRMAIQIDPGQVPTYYNLANTLMANNQPEEAVTYYRSATEKDPKLAPAYYNLAQALAKLGRRDDAVVAMDTFLQVAGKQPDFSDAVVRAKKQLAEWSKIRTP